VIIPVVDSRVEQRNGFVIRGIDGAEIRAFVGVASGTRQSKIARGVTATMLPRADMLDMKADEWCASLR